MTEITNSCRDVNPKDIVSVENMLLCENLSSSRPGNPGALGFAPARAIFDLSTFWSLYKDDVPNYFRAPSAAVLSHHRVKRQGGWRRKETFSGSCNTHTNDNVLARTLTIYATPPASHNSARGKLCAVRMTLRVEAHPFPDATWSLLKCAWHYLRRYFLALEVLDQSYAPLQHCGLAQCRFGVHHRRRATDAGVCALKIRLREGGQT